MNGSRQLVGTVAAGNGSAGSKRPKTIKVAPVTRAVRAALAVSAAAFALAGSGAAFAGDCTTPVDNVIRCNGDFIDTLNFAVEDLTLVVGDESPSTVVPGPGDVGILADWTGSIGVTNHADITTYAADGIHATGAGDIAIDNSGSVSAYGTGDIIAVYAHSSEGDVSVVNSGSLYAYSYDSLGDGIFASGASVDVTNSAGGDILVGGDDWAAGIEAQGDDLTTVRNDGAIAAYSLGGGYAFGIYATGGEGGVTIGNTGTINAQGFYANGIYVQSSGDVAIDNSGTVAGGGLYTSVLGTGIHAASNALDGVVAVDNSGDVVAQGYYGATGVEALATSAGGSAGANNSGDIQASQYSYYGYGATGMVVSADADATIGNSGSIDVSSAGLAYGAVAFSFNGDAGIDNSGDVSVYSTAFYGYASYGLLSASQNGSASVDNSGSVDVATLFLGAGIDASGLDGATVDNSGTVSVDAWRSYGIRAIAGQGDVAIDNSGSVSAIYSAPYGYVGVAAGILASSSAGDIAIGNAGDVYASTTGRAVGIFASAGDGGIAIDSSGSIETYSYGSDTQGIFAAGAGAVAIANSGAIDANGFYAATGIDAYGGDLAGVDNSGSILAIAFGDARGVSAASYDGDVAVGNSGQIRAGSLLLDAIGIYAYSYGDVTVENDGLVVAQSPNGLADGIFASGANVDVSNGAEGQIVAAGYSWAAGIEAQGSDAVGVSNAGDILAVTYGVSEAFGIYASGGAGGVTIDNSGSIQVRGYDVSTGIYASAGGPVDITSSGDVIAGYVAVVDGNLYSSSYASGILALSGTDGAAITIDNSGLAYAASFSGSSGIEARSLGVGGSVDIGNSGDVIAVALAYGAGAAGIAASAEGDAGIDNAGMVYAYSAGTAYGAIALSFNGDASVTNSGDITAVNGAFRYYSAYGIVSASQNGAAGADNEGSISVYSPYIGVGMEVGGLTGATATNGGDIDADAWVSYGARVRSGGGDVSVENGGSIVAHYSGTYLGYSFGMFASTVAGDVSIDNAGDVSADGGLQGVGIFTTTSAGDIGIDSSGDVAAASYVGTAVGVFARATNGTATISTSGGIDSSATYGYAYGVLARGAYLELSNSGDISATGYYGAYGVRLDNSMYATLENSGTITATSENGISTGALVVGYDGGVVSNSGDISASADGVLSAYAVGVFVLTAGDALVENSGTISVSEPDLAVGVRMLAAGTATLENSGTITANASGGGAIALFGSYGANAVHNRGDIHGAIVTFDGDDAFANGQDGNWEVGNFTTYFGGGDDTIDNGAGGTIHLANGAIYLGSSGAAGNAFHNAGTILASGYGLIDMGTGPVSLVPSLNPQALINDGVISFVDGSPDDLLVIVGDLGGDGAIDLDVSLLNGMADLLYVDGSVVDGSTQAINLAIDGMPSSLASDPAPVVIVSGNVAANAFVGGEVLNFDPSNFLDLDVAVSSDDAGGPSVFSASVAVAGLNDAGVLAASVASGAHSLINSSIGTLHQRMGVAPEKLEGQAGLSPWVRLFTDKGDVAPHASGFGSGGDFGFEQENRGREFGMNFAFGNGVSFGVLAGNADGTQDLTGAAGSDRLKLRSSGIYATWTAPRFYVDASWRWMDFDARLVSVGGEQATSGNAEAFNVEAGFTGWSVGGVDVVPQAQYTRAKIDNVEVVEGSLTGFAIEGGVSERGRLGVAVNRSFASAGGMTWTPYGALSAVREFDGASRFTVADTFHGGTDTEGTSTLVELGIGAQKGGFSGTAGVNWTDGGALDGFVGGQLVLRYTW